MSETITRTPLELVPGQEFVTAPQTEYVSAEKGNGPPGGPDIDVEHNTPLFSLADHVLNHFNTNTSGNLFEETGRKLRLTDTAKGHAKDTFSLFLKGTGSAKTMAHEIDTLRSRILELKDPEKRKALRRYINALNFRLAHHNRQQQRAEQNLGENSSGIPLEMLFEAVQTADEQVPQGEQPTELILGDETTTVILPVGADAVVKDNVNLDEMGAIPVETVEADVQQTGEQVTEEERGDEVQVAAESQGATEEGSDHEQLEAAEDRFSQYRQGFLTEPVFTNGPFALDEETKEHIVTAVQNSLSRLRAVAAEQQKPWYQKNPFARTPDAVIVLQSALSKLYPHVNEKIRNTYAYQLAVLAPRPEYLVRMPSQMAGYVRAIDIANGQAQVKPRITGARIPTRTADGKVTRRGFIKLLATEAVAETAGVGPVSSALRAIGSMMNEPVPTAPTTTATPPQQATTEPPPQQATPVPDSNTGKNPIGDEPGAAAPPTPDGQVTSDEIEQMRQQQLQDRKEQLQQTAQEQARLEKIRAELQQLPRIEVLGSKAVVLQGEKGNFAGEYLPQVEELGVDDETAKLLGELKQVIEQKVGETGGHFAIKLSEGKWNFRYSNKNGILHEAPIEVTIDPKQNIRNMTEEQRAALTVDRKSSFSTTDSVALETSGWIYDKDRNVVLIRMQSSYTGDAHQGRPETYGGKWRNGGGVYVEVSPPQALKMAQQGEFGVSAVGCYDAYDNQKLINLWVGLFQMGMNGENLKDKFTYDRYVKENGVTVKRSFTYDVSITEMLSLTDNDVLSNQYVDWLARLNGQNIKSRASGICALASMGMNVMRRLIHAKGLAEKTEEKSQSHSEPELWYGPSGNDPLLQIMNERGEPYMTDRTVITFTDLAARIDATLDVDTDQTLSINSGVLSYDPAQTKMLAFMNASLS